MTAKKEGLMTADQAAGYLGISYMTLARWRREAVKQPRYLKVRHRIYYRQSDLDEYLKACEVEVMHG